MVHSSLTQKGELQATHPDSYSSQFQE